MFKLSIAIILLIGLSPLNLMSQSFSDTTLCYVNSISESDKAFERIEHTAQFKGGHNAFLNFLMGKISFQNIVTHLNQNERVYSDTARIKFIISKEGVMSNLSVTHTQKDIFLEEIVNVIKQSSCYWLPGTNGGRLNNSWLQLDIYYSIDRTQGGIITSVKYKSYDFVTE
jgi:hypothetical protein